MHIIDEIDVFQSIRFFHATAFKAMEKLFIFSKYFMKMEQFDWGTVDWKFIFSIFNLVCLYFVNFQLEASFNIINYHKVERERTTGKIRLLTD